VAAACGHLGLCYNRTGDYGRARELHEQQRAICEALGDREGVAAACGNLGRCYFRTGDYGRARELHEQDKSLCEALGDRAGVAAACGNLGNCYDCTGDYGRARELHEQDRAICEALGDRRGVAAACCNLGNCYFRTGDYGRARELHEQNRAICEELGDRQGVAAACGNLGGWCLNFGDYAAAISYFNEEYSMAGHMQLEQQQGAAALGIGIALSLQTDPTVPGRAVAPGCSGDAACECEAEKWLFTAFKLGHTIAHLHLARVAFDLGNVQAALAYLEGYLSYSVAQAPNWCLGCGQKRGADAPMLTCSGCRVARFCSVEHQKIASRDVSRYDKLLHGRHRDLCGLLGTWRQQVVKGGASPNTLRADLVTFLRQPWKN
jgi:tetratricopeptide (TPR) repeat protein